jgi:phosphoadenosine phosphosulfate reductase
LKISGGKEAGKMKDEELEELRRKFEGQPPQQTLRWALDRFYPTIAFACSFGAEDMVLLDMISKMTPRMRVFYIDTGLLFKETYELIEKAAEKYGIKPERYAPELTLERQRELYGENLYQRNPDLCCQIRKVEPLKKALAGLEAWVTGIRREQSPTRASAAVVERDRKFGLVKVNPLVHWTFKDVWKYITENHVPYNPLHDRNYPSIGCTLCTTPVAPGEDPRAGRWRGRDKKECGLHL